MPTRRAPAPILTKVQAPIPQDAVVAAAAVLVAAPILTKVQAPIPQDAVAERSGNAASIAGDGLPAKLAFATARLVRARAGVLILDMLIVLALQRTLQDKG